MDDYRRHPTLTGYWADQGLTPLPEARQADTRVWFALSREDDDGGVQVWEELVAATTGENVVTVRAVPLFVYNVNYGDEVEVVASREGELVATGLVRDAGNYTFRVALPSDAPDSRLDDLIRGLAQAGCLIEGYTRTLLGLSCRPEDLKRVAAQLRHGEEHGMWEYETGRQ